MFNSPILDLVILLSFIYFAGSLIMSAINEAIAGSLSLRPKQLEASFEALLFDNMWPTFLRTQLVTSPHIESLMKAKGVYPSYIPAQNFVLAVIGIIGDDKYTADGLVDAIRTTPSLPPQFQKILADYAAQADKDLNKFEKSLATFYTNAMERTGGVYKRKIRSFLFVLGFLIAFCGNLDTLKIAQDALSNKAQLAQTVDKVVSQMPAISDQKGTVDVKYKGGDLTVAEQDTGKMDPSEKVAQIGKITQYLQDNSGITLGYTNYQAFTDKWSPGWNHWRKFCLSLMGILLTTFALQLSSSFWFDLMNKAVNVRAAGSKPDAKKNK